MSQPTFIPETNTRVEFVRGKKKKQTLATIDRNKDGFHFCFIRHNSMGFITPTLNEGKKRVQACCL